MLTRKSALLAAPLLTLGAIALASSPAMAAVVAPAASAVTVPALGTAPATAGAITIKDFAYQGPGTVAPGAKITVTNQDSEAHTVTADSGNAFNVTIAAGATATFTAPSSPGSYAFHCNFHGNMHGSLTVQAAASSAPVPAQAPAAQPTTPAAAQPTTPAAPQMTHMPVGAAATGVAAPADPAGIDVGLIAGGGVLVLAAGGAFAARRRILTKP